jgi:hypothetical protein
MKLVIEGMYLNIIKAIDDKPFLGKNKTIFSKIRNETRVSTLSTLIQHSLGISSWNSIPI